MLNVHVENYEVSLPYKSHLIDVNSSNLLMHLCYVGTLNFNPDAKQYGPRHIIELNQTEWMREFMKRMVWYGANTVNEKYLQLLWRLASGRRYMCCWCCCFFFIQISYDEPECVTTYRFFYIVACCIQFVFFFAQCILSLIDNTVDMNATAFTYDGIADTVVRTCPITNSIN